MIDIPQAAVVVLCTGIITIVSSVLTHFFLIRTEEKRAAREDARATQARRNEWELKRREIRAAKLAELWLAIELSKERISDAQLQAKLSDGSDMPLSKDLAAQGTSAAYGISLMHFPELRPLVYSLHVETVKYEAGLRWDELEDEDAQLERWANLRTELADAIETKAREIQSDL